MRMRDQKNLSNIRPLIQSFLVGVVSGIFIILALFYAVLGMCPKSFNIINFITKIPLYPVDFIGEICCSFSLIDKENKIPFLRIGVDMTFIWIVFCVIFYIYKPKLHNLTLIARSCLVWIIVIVLIDFISHPNITFGLILTVLLVFPFKKQIKKLLEKK
jgi:hypothetical protein